MLGFVSALSSTLAIVVLISSVLLVNLLTFTLNKSEKDYQLKLNENVMKQEEASSVNLSGVSISKNIISLKELPPRNSSITDIVTGCSYGNNFSYEVAAKLSTLNYIILAKNFIGTNVKITLEQPILDEKKVNDCWVTQGVGDK
ncbi:hypothetical protein JMJ20_005175 [Escherichia coli]|nr:hypothetical protein [Escherichia coli]EHE8558797.1 hypothetical protein [Escherichia coli]